MKEFVQRGIDALIHVFFNSGFISSAVFGVALGDPQFIPKTSNVIDQQRKIFGVRTGFIGPGSPDDRFEIYSLIHFFELLAISSGLPTQIDTREYRAQIFLTSAFP